MKYFRLLFTICLILTFAIGIHSAHAAELQLEANKKTVAPTDEFLVTVTLSTGESVNAVEGSISFPVDFLEVKTIRDGNSSITLWIERPRVDERGTIVFAGISPGGINNIESSLFSIVFKAKRTGEAHIAMQDVTVLHNDGLGTELPVTHSGAHIAIAGASSGREKEILSDVTPPESFTPFLARDESVGEGKWFVAFATQDKTSGIHHFEVKEYRLGFLKDITSWRRAESPYILSDQELKSTIIIRALDNAGNKRDIVINPGSPLSWRDYVPIVGTVLGASIMLWYAIYRICKRK